MGGEIFGSREIGFNDDRPAQVLDQLPGTPQLLSGSPLPVLAGRQFVSDLRQGLQRPAQGSLASDDLGCCGAGYIHLD